MSDTNPLMVWEQMNSQTPAPTVDNNAWGTQTPSDNWQPSWWMPTEWSTPAPQTPDSIASQAEKIMQEMNTPSWNAPAQSSPAPTNEDLMPAVKEALRSMGIDIDKVPSNNDQTKPSENTNTDVAKMLEAKTLEVEQYKIAEAQRQQEFAKAAEDKKVLWSYIEKLIAENASLKNWNQFSDETQKNLNELYWTYISNPSDQVALWNFVKTVSDFIDKNTWGQLNIAKIVLQQIEAAKWSSVVPSQNGWSNPDQMKTLQMQQDMGIFIPVI